MNKRMEPDKNAVPTLWGIGDSERLTYTDPYEAVREHVEWLWDEKIDIPPTLRVQGYAPGVPVRSDLPDLLQIALEALDEHYGDPDGDCLFNDPSEELEGAYLAFVDMLLKEFPVWTCFPVGEPIEIETGPYVKELSK